MSASKNFRKFLQLALLAAVLVAALTAGYFYTKYQKLKNNPDLLSKEELSIIVTSIKKYMDLPDEEPTLATINDKSKLQTQEFFRKAENGDKILIYPKAKKAILYRPETNRVIEFAPLSIGNGSQVSTPSASKLVSVAIYNGSTLSGLTNEVEKNLADIKGISVVSKENAKKRNYPKTLVIDLSGNNDKLVTSLAEKLSAEIVLLPKDEKKPDADVLIIAASAK